jgi:phospholipid/cholesterol/gamma-HCH transport system substrate-binding protein
MSVRGNPKLIGAFVVGAAALVVVGIMVFGSGRWFSERPVYVMFFEGSVKGLNVGAPVVWRGVKVGVVTDVSLHFDPATLTMRIPVLVEFDPKTIKKPEGTPPDKRYYRELIDKGLKAQLQMQSLLTGQLMIDFDYYPDEPIRLYADRFKMDYPEIPTIPSTIERFAESLAKIDFEKMANDLSATLEGINTIVKSPEILATVRNVNAVVTDLRNLAAKIDRHVDPLAEEITGTAKETKKLLAELNTTIPPLAADIGKTAQAASDAVLQLESALQRAIGEDSPFFYRLNRAVEDLSTMAKSIEVLSDYIQQHPEAMIRGKGTAAER